LTNLYDWYLSQGWSDRILQADNPFVDPYLNKRARDDLAHADLLWQYYVLRKQFYDAANIQFEIAQSSFILTLDKRIEYLSQAKANISTRAPSGRGPRGWQELKFRISSSLEIATIQDDILQRLKEDPRVPPETKPQVLSMVDGPILTMQEVSPEITLYITVLMNLAL
jgi:nuclear pore complex protein Nup155